MYNYVVKYIPVDTCNERTVYLLAENRLNAINKILERDKVKKFTTVKLWE